MKFTMYHSCITVLDLEKSIAFYEKRPLAFRKSDVWKVTITRLSLWERKEIRVS